MHQYPKIVSEAKLRKTKDGAIVTLYGESHFQVNESGLEIIKLCNGRTPTEKIYKIFATKNGIKISLAKKKVDKYLNLLSKIRIVRGV